jgi:hypothetical protein
MWKIIWSHLQYHINIWTDGKFKIQWLSWTSSLCFMFPYINIEITLHKNKPFSKPNAFSYNNMWNTDVGKIALSTIYVIIWSDYSFLERKLYYYVFLYIFSELGYIFHIVQCYVWWNSVKLEGKKKKFCVGILLY